MTKTQSKANAKAGEVERWLDSIDWSKATMRDATHLRRIMGAVEQIDAAEAELFSAVQAARDAGDPWLAIALALGTSKQAAHQRFAKRTG